MSSELRTWVETQLSTLYTTEDDATFDSTYADTFAPDVTMELAHAPTEADGTPKPGIVISAGRGVQEKSVKAGDAKEALGQTAKPAGQSHSTIEFGDVKVDDKSGKITGQFTVTRNLKFRIRAAPAQMRHTVHFDATVSPAQGNARRITQFAQTVESHRSPVTMAHLPHQPRKPVEDL